MADFDVSNQGSIVLLTPRSAEANDWAAENLPSSDDALMYGCSYVVEPRYIMPILEGILGCGFTIEEC